MRSVWPERRCTLGTVRRGPVLEVIELGELTVATLLRVPVQRTVTAGEGERPEHTEEVVVLQA